MRRLPVFFLLDVSESMVGDNLDHLEQGLAQLVRVLRTDPHALETVHISVVAFAGQARLLASLIELAAFYPPQLPVGSGTALGKALNFLMDEMTRVVRRNSSSEKGDWKPIIFLITDGKPTDEIRPALRRWQAHYRPHANLVAISIGRNSDLQALRELTDYVMVFEESQQNDFRRCLQWVTDSIRSQSRSVMQLGSDALNLAKQEAIFSLETGKPARALDLIDERYAIFTGKCQKKQQLYLVKYEALPDEVAAEVARLLAERGAAPPSGSGKLYHLIGAWPVKNDYFEMSDNLPKPQTISPTQLDRIPGCPQCTSRYALAGCPQCGKIFCLDDPGEQICAWCSASLFSAAAQEGEPLDGLVRSRG